MAGLPSGAVTFLFTDIEGSTRLVKQLREHYGDVLEEHQRLLRAAFDAHGGHEVDTQGDSFFVAFASARDGLLAAVDGQRALAAHPWPEGVRITVRMGLHTGQAIAARGRYTGLAVHRAARIGAAGHGGQILVSQATQTLLEDEEETLPVTLRDLGQQQLKDLDRPVRLYQAAGRGLPDEFPPPRSNGQAARVGPEPVARWRRPAAIAAGALTLAAVGVGATAAVVFDDAASVAVVPNSVAVIDPETNRVVDSVAVGARPGPVEYGAGSVWVGNLDDRNLTRIDARSRTVLGTIPLEKRTPTGIAFGFGFVWVAHGRLGDLSRVDPQFNEPAPPIDVADPFFGSPNGSVATGLGSVWAVFGDSTLARIEPAAGRVAEWTRAGSLPAGITIGSGSVWVANSGDATVTRYNPATFTEAPLDIFRVGRRPTGIAAGEEAIWVANTASDSLRRIDPSSGDEEPIAVESGATAVAVGEDGVWVANPEAGTLSRIDPETNEVDTIELGRRPSGVVAADGLVWVTIQAP
jgi:class 3 adenylate cyclase/DNA-binding beta-propeller fold protein YncE